MRLAINFDDAAAAYHEDYLVCGVDLSADRVLQVACSIPEIRSWMDLPYVEVYVGSPAPEVEVAENPKFRAGTYTPVPTVEEGTSDTHALPDLQSFDALSFRMGYEQGRKDGFDKGFSVARSQCPKTKPPRGSHR